ncbi:hypothetical protein GCM10023230_03400 [Flavobacterium hankyongi]|uniref:Uncharacterized protein n=1 Tax=Flavobacterium hankyongi TaxID=1176532 RepID=A0ABP8ZKE3_9FLAO
MQVISKKFKVFQIFHRFSFKYAALKRKGFYLVFDVRHFINKIYLVVKFNSSEKECKTYN